MYKACVGLILFLSMVAVTVAQEGIDSSRERRSLLETMLPEDSLDFMLMEFPDRDKLYRQTYTFDELTLPAEKKPLYVKSTMGVNYCADSLLVDAMIHARLKMNWEEYSFGTTQFKDTVKFRIVGFSSTGTVLMNDTIMLNIMSNAGDVRPEQRYRKSFKDDYYDIDSFQVIILQHFSSYAASAQSALEDSLLFEVFYTEEFARSAIHAIDSTEPVVEVVALPNVVSANSITFEWDLIPECLSDSFPNYQLQILRLYNRDGNDPGQDEQDVVETVDWSRALTVETGNAKRELTLTIAEGTGYYVWRVRPIGDIFPGGIANDRNWGIWSAAPANGATLTIPNTNKDGIDAAIRPSIFFYQQFDRSKNWAYQRTFTEGTEGTRIGEEISYATSLLQPNQEQVHLQSKDSILVSSVVMDFTGRPSVRSMTAPVGNDYLGYQNDFVQTTAGGGTPHLYTASDFDTDALSTNPRQMDAGGPSQYYSDANADLQVPNADGFPYTRALFYPDASGRAREAGGMGKVHRVGSTVATVDRTIKTYYAQASEDELLAMFGDEAPVDSTVQKVITIDPNKVAGVQYLAHDGSLLATCLIKYQTAPNTSLQELQEAEILTQTVHQKVMNDVQTGENSSSASTRIFIAEESSLELDYSITPSTIELLCADYCSTCDYIVKFLVFSAEDPSTPVFEGAKELLPNGCESTPFDTVMTTDPLPAGSYIVERRITTNNRKSATTNYAELHADSVATRVRRQTDELLTEVRRYLSVVEVDSMYRYLDSLVSVGEIDTLEHDLQETKKYVLYTDCCEITIPKLSCDDSPCGESDMSFEQALYDKWGATWGNNLDKYFYLQNGAAMFPHDPVENASGRGGFDSLVKHMSADGYDCAKLWTAWRVLVETFGYVATTDGSGDPAKSRSDFDLLETFLSRVGKKYRGVSNCPYDTCLGTYLYGRGYLEYAYLYFRYETSPYNIDHLHNQRHIHTSGLPPVPLFNNRSGECEEYFGVSEDVVHIILPFFPPNRDIYTIASTPPWGEDSLVAVYDSATGRFLGKNWESFYNCLKGGRKPPIGTNVPAGCSDPYDNGCVLAMKEQHEDSCRNLCEQRLPGFITSVIDAYHRAGKTVEGDDHTPDGLPIDETGRILDENGEPTDSVVTLVTLREIECHGWVLVDNCQAGCTLTVKWKNNDPATQQIDTVGTWLERQRFSESMTYTYKVDLPTGGTCGNGMSIVKSRNPQQSFARWIVHHLNDSLAKFRLTLGGETDPSPGTIAEWFYNYFSSLSGIVGCRWYERSTPTYPSGDSCCPDIGMPAIFTLNSHIKSAFTVDGCKLVYVRMCTLNGIPVFQRDTLCNDICTSNCGDSLCFAWVPMEAGDTTAVILPLLCEQELVRRLNRTIDNQVNDCIDREVSRVNSLYRSICAEPTAIRDTFTVSYSQSLYHFTLYYHDRAGNLVKTVPPAGFRLRPVIQRTRAFHTIHVLETVYEYNSLKQLITKKTPDGGLTTYWYNDRGQVRFVRDARQNAINRYSYTKYDALGRVIQTGENSAAITALDANIAQANYPTTGSDEVVRSFYNDPGNYHYHNDVGRPQRYTRNRLSYTMADTTAATAYSYDPHGNVEWIVQWTRGLGNNFVRYEYDLNSANPRVVHYNEGRVDRLSQRYSYDEDNRHQMVESSRDGVIWDRDAIYSHYLHGPLRRIELGQDKLQGTDYTYTIQGWLKGVNHPSLTTSVDPGKDANGTSRFAPDAFGMTLGYFAGDFGRRKMGVGQSPFNSIPGTAGYLVRSDTLNGSPLYDGNIASWTSQTMQSGGGHNYEQLVGERYLYDRLSRLLQSDFSPYTSGQVWQATNDYDTRYSYDPSDNIKTLTRKGSAASSYGTVDSLSYWYLANSNKLNYVDDAKVAGLPATDLDDQATGNYKYDASGNLISDVQEGVNTILWSHTGKVLTVRKPGGGEIRFMYDAMGNRVKKIVDIPGQYSTTYYVYDAGGKVLAIYKKNCADSDGRDIADNGPSCFKVAGPADTDRDGVPDSQDNAVGTFNPDQLDTDGDGTGDMAESDADNDGIVNLSDPCPFDPGNSCSGDADSDGIPDGSDPCPSWPGTGGGDADGDGTPNGCDIDLDGDGVANHEDNCPWKYNPGQQDGNSNGIGDSCECASGSGGGSCVFTDVELLIYGNGTHGRFASVKPWDFVRDTIIRTNDTIFTRMLRRKEYELKDHLGDLRVAISDLKLNDPVANTPGRAPFLADLVTYMNYYPFGMAHPGRVSNVGYYRYGFNGKEMDNEWNDRNQVPTANAGVGNSYDYGFRIYNPRLGKFLSTDPLDSEYPWYTPYQFAGNTPIQAVDLDGLEPARAPLMDQGAPAYMIPDMSLADNKRIGTHNKQRYDRDLAASRAARAARTKAAVPTSASSTAVGIGLAIGTAAEYIGGGATITAGFTIASTVFVTATVFFIPSNINQDVRDQHHGRYARPVSEPQPKAEPVGGPATPLLTPKDDRIKLHRGVYEGHPDYVNAENGMAVPRGLIGGHSDPIAHASGNNFSIFTSWTQDMAVARRFALRRKSDRTGPGGIVLTKRFWPAQVIKIDYVNNPSIWQFRNQGEYVVPGVVSGASKQYVTQGQH